MSSPQSLTTTATFGLPDSEPCASIALTTSDPLFTSPKTVCLPSSQGVGTVVMKNWEPLVLRDQFRYEEETRRVLLGPGVGHAEEEGLVVLELKVLVGELGSHASLSRSLQ